jgi:uncharacterized membrane protein
MNELAAWAPFGAALAAFLLSHTIPARPGVRRRLVAMLGVRTYLVLYSLASLLLLGWLVQAAGSAPFVELWAFANWQRHVTATLVPIAFAIGAVGLFTPNPMSLTASRRSFDAARRGVIALTRHPVLLALALWAAAHLVPNGDLAHVILFGTFLVLALGGMLIMDQRARRRLGPDDWTALVRRYPVLGWPGGAWIDRSTFVTGVLGALTALAFAAVHGQIIGVPAFSP